MVVGSVVLLIGLLGCKSGIKSEACVEYFAKNEACAAKAPQLKGDILRKTAATSKENFEKNSNPMAVSESCKAMLQALENDPDCK
ncbi:MAG: hypothetical protein KIS78_34585 [Labilithrix sp.]|nr:hypothetical protein [Labilithrix sp.]